MDALMPAKDPTKFDMMVKKLEYLKSPAAKQELVVLMAETAMAQVNLGFRTSTSPDGFTWPALSSRPGGKPLQDTRRNLQGSISPRFGSGRFRLVTAFIGAKAHQYGATIRPVRAKALRWHIKGSEWTHAQKRLYQRVARDDSEHFMEKDAKGRLIDDKGRRAKRANLDSFALPASAEGKFAFAQKVVIPQRQFFPTGPRAPDRWRLAFEATHRRFMSRIGKP